MKNLTEHRICGNCRIFKPRKIGKVPFEFKGLCKFKGEVGYSSGACYHWRKKWYLVTNKIKGGYKTNGEINSTPLLCKNKKNL